MSARTTIRAALALATGLVAACTGAIPEGTFSGGGQGGGQLCRQVDAALLRGQRNSFGLNFRAAEDAFAELLSLYALDDVAQKCPEAPSQAFVMMNQALALSSQERFVTADGLFDRAQALVDEQAGAPTAERDRALLKAYRAQDQLNRSAVGNARGLVEQAAVGLGGPSEFGRDAAPRADQGLIQTSGAEQLEVIEEASNLHTLSHVRLMEGDLKGASQAIDSAMELINQAPMAVAAYRPRFLSQRSLVELEKGDFEAARRDATAAAESFSALMPDTPLEARARLREGRALQALGKPDAALAAFERGFQVYEENPVVVDYGSLWPFFSQALKIAAEDPARQREIGDRVFRAAQLVRQSITARTVSGAAALLGEGDNEKARAVRAWRDATERYANLKALQVLQLRDPLSQPEQAKALAASVAEAQETVQRLREERDRIAPEYQSAIASPVPLEQLQSVLQDGEALVQILVGQPRSLILIIDKDGIDFGALPATSGQIGALVGVLRMGVQSDRDGRVPPFRADVSFTLFNLLFPGWKDRLMGHDRLIFATSGALQSLPLELLATDPPGQEWTEGDYSDVPFLGAQRAVSYVPSPRNLVDIRLRAGRSQAREAVAAFADFRSGVDPQKVLEISRLPESCLKLAQAINRVGELPGTAQEAEVIQRIFGDRALVETGTDFNEDMVKKAGADGTLADYRVVHFATHGILWPTPDCFSEPALTVTATGSADSDGLLDAAEIRMMNLDAQLVTLSACNTASGYLAQISGAPAGPIGAGGESLSGLARAFFAAGARAVLATHWPVADKETTELMDRFFTQLEGGQVDFATALQQAQSELRQNPATSHPIFWGPFVLIGDASQTL